MGMFDYVIGISINCPKCGIEHKFFQSKDLDCSLDTVNYRRIEYRRKRAKDLSDFMKVTK